MVRASDGVAGGARDGLRIGVPVLAPQGDVWLATSFALAANGSKATAQEGMVLPAAVPGSGGWGVWHGRVVGKAGYAGALLSSACRGMGCGH